MSPATLFRRVAVTEAVTWALLLTGMVLKYGTGTTELGVRVFGMVHGVVFIGYCLVTVLLAVDQRWSFGRLVVGLAAAVPPFLTLWFERYAAARGLLPLRWRLTGDPAPAGEGQGLMAPTAQTAPAAATAPRGPHERAVAWLLRNPARGALTGLLAVGVLTGVALALGPPV
ncbi:DUF3817 domain-containing protein [Nocardioides donggukensis]|uniref:DUF3817 domain-containing protein n=1 Tax=Nocardioides donggukensis TaxID=2774019 RepID=A0A927K3U0_9ACTN|nr:DUF3817 domain-containing protein [Nocardioides donggukensis]MBD8868268.1 DUF3817 domain-containing protein [Nocardioides donggukensis]